MCILIKYKICSDVVVIIGKYGRFGFRIFMIGCGKFEGEDEMSRGVG